MVQNEGKIGAQDLLIDYRSYYGHLLVIDRILELDAPLWPRRPRRSGRAFNVFFNSQIALARIVVRRFSRLSAGLEFETF